MTQSLMTQFASRVRSTVALRSRTRRAVQRMKDKLFRRDLDGVADVKKRHATFAELRAEICRSGTDDLENFGADYTEEGGLYLQQNPDEFTALCLFLQERTPLARYLEIGSASGGACLFLHRRLTFDEVFSLDDHQHRRAVEQPRNFAQIPRLKQFVGDSHSEEARGFLETEVRTPLDVILIDGDHSYEGALKDVELVLPFCREGTLVIFHDTVACPDVRAVWMHAIRNNGLKPVAEYVGDSAPMGIGVSVVARANSSG